jgi:exodeoxyribonuclease V beta subunit
MRNLDLNDPDVLQHSLVVSASAGSGKTFTLTALVTAVLGREQARPYEILATTFSEAATADLRERLLRPLDLLAALDRPAWKQLLPVLGEPAGIIADALRPHVAEGRAGKSIAEVAQAGVLWAGAAWAADPARALAFWRRVRREAELLAVSTIHGLAMGLLAQGEGAPEAILDVEHPALLRLLRQTLREKLTVAPDHPDRLAATELLAWAERGRNWVRISAGHDGHRDAMGHLQPVDLEPLRAAFAAALARAESRFAPLALEPGLAVDRNNRYSHNFKPENILQVPGPSAEGRRRLRWARQQSEAIGKPAGYYTPALVEAMETLGPVADAWEAWLGALLGEALAAFESRKSSHGQGTFGDLVRHALAGLESGALEPPRPRLLLVDECQDVSRAQDAFLTALGAARIIRVGDLKQAIYGFRGGDPELLRGHLEAAGDAAYRLPTNFRSTPEVVDLANRFVEELWPQLDPAAGNLDGHQEWLGAASVPIGLVRRPWAGRGSNLPELSDWIVALSQEEGWNQALGGPVQPAPRRRALLLARRTRLARTIRDLKAHGVQPYVVAKEGFWESPGVRLAMAALEAVAHPDRPRPCAALLRNLLGVSDGELAALATRAEAPGLPGLGGLEPEAFAGPQRPGVVWLQSLARATSQELLGQLLVQGGLLRAVNALAVHGTMEPPRARRNLAGFLAMVLALPASPMAAYAALEEAREGPAKGDLPALAEGADLIIQTVHASKGLEYDDVILPLLNDSATPLKTGDLKTDPASQALALVWKLGSHEGASYRALRAGAEQRERGDRLNLLYVALTRARSRLCLLLQEPAKPKALAESNSWATWGPHLAGLHPQFQLLTEAPAVARRIPAPAETPRPPAARKPLPAEPASEGPVKIQPATQARARKDGEAMHAYLRDLLIRWEDPAAFQACLDAPPRVAKAREHALGFLEAFEAKGWRPLRRRTELPLAGAAASGAEGRADLVVWDGARVHVLDFKNSKDLGAEELAAYGGQLRRYAEALRAREGLPVVAWLVPLKGTGWVAVPT